MYKIYQLYIKTRNQLYDKYIEIEEDEDILEIIKNDIIAKEIKEPYFCGSVIKSNNFKLKLFKIPNIDIDISFEKIKIKLDYKKCSKLFCFKHSTHQMINMEKNRKYYYLCDKHNEKLINKILAF